MGNTAANRGARACLFLCTVALVLVCCSCASLSPQARLDDLFGSPSFAAARWGAAVRSLETGELLYLRDEEKLFMPASTMKLFTTAAALVRLGPGFRYTTGLFTGGDISNGVLEGDLIVRGSGDPTLSPGALEAWADVLSARGIVEIRGAVVGDDNVFDDQPLGAGWSWDDETFGYAAQISGLSLNENVVTVEIAPAAEEGAPARISVSPATGYVTVVNTAGTAPAGRPAALRIVREPGTNRIIISGAVALQSAPLRERVSVHNPTLFAATALRKLLEARGIRVTGGAVDIDGRPTPVEYAALRCIAVHTSPPLGEIIATANKLSKNIYAEQLFRTLGAAVGGEGSARRSAEVVTETLGRLGVPLEGLSVQDGSGLSRLNLVTPLQTVLLLDAMARQEHFRAFYDSLPAAGVDGTLAGRMKGTRAAERVRAKTGYFRQVRALAGYVTTQEGELLAFSLLANNYLGAPAETRALQDSFCEVLAGLSRSR